MPHAGLAVRGVTVPQQKPFGHLCLSPWPNHSWKLACLYFGGFVSSVFPLANHSLGGLCHVRKGPGYRGSGFILCSRLHRKSLPGRGQPCSVLSDTSSLRMEGDNSELPSNSSDPCSYKMFQGVTGVMFKRPDGHLWLLIMEWALGVSSEQLLYGKCYDS